MHRKVFLNLTNNSKEIVEKLSAYLRQHPNVIYLVKPIGSYDYEFELISKSHEDFHKIITDLIIRFSKDIKNYSTVVHYREPKVWTVTKYISQIQKSL